METQVGEHEVTVTKSDPSGTADSVETVITINVTYAACDYS
jgi:hypothetical protein